MLDRETKEKLEAALRMHGFKIKIGGCGCCDSPWVRGALPDGTTFDLEGQTINTERSAED